MPELPEEMNTFHKQQSLQKQISMLRKLREELNMHRDTIRNTATNEEDDSKTQQELLRNIQKDDEM